MCSGWVALLFLLAFPVWASGTHHLLKTILPTFARSAGERMLVGVVHPSFIILCRLRGLNLSGQAGVDYVGQYIVQINVADRAVNLQQVRDAVAAKRYGKGDRHPSQLERLLAMDGLGIGAFMAALHNAAVQDKSHLIHSVFCQVVCSLLQHSVCGARRQERSRVQLCV